MPDLASDDLNLGSNHQLRSQIDWVGMESMMIPIKIKAPDGAVTSMPAHVDAFVSLDDPDIRGIHMSRLFVAVESVFDHFPFSLESIHKILEIFRSSHHSLSANCRLSVAFDYLVKRPALKSNFSGWRSYPVKVTATRIGDDLELEQSLQITYSSTCPCSAALARQLTQKSFADQHAKMESVKTTEVVQWLGSQESATPHSQRSHLDVRVVQAPSVPSFLFSELIDSLEGILKTAVQGAVKREDEQEFARINGQNLMFCEDAARRARYVLEHDLRIIHYWIKASHLESLHAHNAVSYVTKSRLAGPKNKWLVLNK